MSQGCVFYEIFDMEDMLPFALPTTATKARFDYRLLSLSKRIQRLFMTDYAVCP
jgi:hypothetical protein